MGLGGSTSSTPACSSLWDSSCGCDGSAPPGLCLLQLNTPGPVAGMQPGWDVQGWVWGWWQQGPL